jgi:hypothetical protein
MASLGIIFILENDDLNGIFTLNHALVKQMNETAGTPDPMEVKFLEKFDEGFCSKFKEDGATIVDSPSRTGTDTYKVAVVNGRNSLHYALCNLGADQIYFICHSLNVDNALPPPASHVGGANVEVIATSERQKSYIESALGWGETDVVLKRNAIDLTRFTETAPTVPQSEVTRILVLDIRNNAFYRDKIINVASLIPKTYVRVIDTPIWEIETEIEEAHCVIAYGRSAIESMAMGRHTIIYGVNGGDGLVTAANVAELAKTNFSGYSVRNMPIPEHLTEMDLVEQLTLISDADMANVQSAIASSNYDIVDLAAYINPNI